MLLAANANQLNYKIFTQNVVVRSLKFAVTSNDVILWRTDLAQRQFPLINVMVYWCIGAVVGHVNCLCMPMCQCGNVARSTRHTFFLNCSIIMSQWLLKKGMRWKLGTNLIYGRKTRYFTIGFWKYLNTPKFTEHSRIEFTEISVLHDCKPIIC